MISKSKRRKIKRQRRTRQKEISVQPPIDFSGFRGESFLGRDYFYIPYLPLNSTIPILENQNGDPTLQIRTVSLADVQIDF